MQKKSLMNKISTFIMKTELRSLIFFSFAPGSISEPHLHMLINTPSINASCAFKTPSIPFWGWKYFHRNNNDTMLYLKASPRSSFFHVLFHSYMSRASVASWTSCDMWEHFTSHSILFLIFLFSPFHALQLSFSHSQRWSRRMLTDQMNSMSPLTRSFLSPCVWITLLRKLHDPGRLQSQRRDQPRGARPRSFVQRPGLPAPSRSREGDPIAGVPYETAGSPAKREAIYSSRLLLVG